MADVGAAGEAVHKMPQHYLRRTYAAKVKAVDAPKHRMHADELVAPHLGASFYANLGRFQYYRRNGSTASTDSSSTPCR